MKTSIKDRVSEDMALMEQFIVRDGDVPATVFFHFDKVNRKIANMMNKVPAGKIAVKNGFFYAINDPEILENRIHLMAHLGTIFAAMKLLDVIEEPKQVVLCAEAFMSTRPKKVRPSEDPKAKDVFIGAGLTIDGDMEAEVKEKRMKIIKDGEESRIEAELVPFKQETSMVDSPSLTAFFESYKHALTSLEKDGSYKQFVKTASEEPVDTFRQAFEAALIITRIGAMTQN